MRRPTTTSTEIWEIVGISFLISTLAIVIAILPALVISLTLLQASQ